eukprot:1158494-Pelagomonas_calceolata.AAC.4
MPLTAFDIESSSPIYNMFSMSETDSWKRVKRGQSEGGYKADLPHGRSYRKLNSWEAAGGLGALEQKAYNQAFRNGHIAWAGEIYILLAYSISLLHHTYKSAKVATAVPHSSNVIVITFCYCVRLNNWPSESFDAPKQTHAYARPLKLYAVGIYAAPWITYSHGHMVSEAWLTSGSALLLLLAPYKPLLPALLVSPSNSLHVRLLLYSREKWHPRVLPLLTMVPSGTSSMPAPDSNLPAKRGGRRGEERKGSRSCSCSPGQLRLRLQQGSLCLKKYLKANPGSDITSPLLHLIAP